MRKISRDLIYAHIGLRHRWEGVMGSSQHKSPHQARAFRRGTDVVTSAEISPSRRTNDAVCIFSYEYLSKTAKSNFAVKRIRGSARWADFTIRPTVNANTGLSTGIYFIFYFFQLRFVVSFHLRF